MSLDVTSASTFSGGYGSKNKIVAIRKTKLLPWNKKKLALKFSEKFEVSERSSHLRCSIKTERLILG